MADFIYSVRLILLARITCAVLAVAAAALVALELRNFELGMMPSVSSVPMHTDVSRVPSEHTPVYSLAFAKLARDAKVFTEETLASEPLIGTVHAKEGTTIIFQTGSALTRVEDSLKAVVVRGGEVVPLEALQVGDQAVLTSHRMHKLEGSVASFDFRTITVLHDGEAHVLPRANRVLVYEASVVSSIRSLSKEVQGFLLLNDHGEVVAFVDSTIGSVLPLAEATFRTPVNIALLGSLVLGAVWLLMSIPTMLAALRRLRPVGVSAASAFRLKVQEVK